MTCLFTRLLECLYRRIVGEQPNAAAYRRHRNAAVNKSCN